MLRRALPVLAAFLLVAPAVARAQDRPFVFSLSTSTADTPRRVLVDVDFGAGEQTFRSSIANGPEERIGVRAFFGRVTLVGQVGLATAEGAYDTSQQAEALVSLLAKPRAGFSVAAGGGLLHEPDGVNVLLGRVVVARETDRTRLIGNVLLQHARSPTRDPLDLVTTVGWSARLTPAVSLGAEAIGEDLEGFWNPAEAEGGARLLVGPSLHVAPPAARWEISVAGGPTFHPTTSGFSSGAVRDLPPTTAPGTGYAVRLAFGCRLGG